MNPDEQVAQFKASIADDYVFADLFDHVPGVVFFVKDRQCRLMIGNEALPKLCGEPSMQEVVGKTGYDYWPKGIADRFEHDDQQVMSDGGRPLIDLIELIIDEEGRASSKMHTLLAGYSEY